MQQDTRADITALEQALDAVERDAKALVAGLSEELGTWRADETSWSVAQCLDHLATTNRAYLRAMQPEAERAMAERRRRRRPALPGPIGAWFARLLEPPVTRKAKAPRAIRPRPSPGLYDAAGEFLASHDELRAFVRRFADIDLAGVRFPNPLIHVIRLSLASGLHVLASHERRHLWQARRAGEAAAGVSRSDPV